MQVTSIWLSVRMDAYRLALSGTSNIVAGNYKVVIAINGTA